MFTVEQWKLLHDGVRSVTLADDALDDEASDVVITYLTERGFMLDPEGDDNDPVLSAQALLEIGFKLGRRPR
jgi:hypothetical protein